MHLQIFARLVRHLKPLLEIVGLALLSLHATAAKLDSTIAIGSSATVWSSVLKEQRRIFIYLPPYYVQSGKAYPVLYLLDAEAQFHSATGIVEFLARQQGRIPELIVIGIANAHRTRDLTPFTHDRNFADAGYGGADAFLGFLADELFPWVNARLRTQPYRILVGHSYGGLFNTHALITRPDAFQAHIAISPALWWDTEDMVARVDAGIRNIERAPWLFLSWGDQEPKISGPTGKLVASLVANPPAGFRWKHRHYPGEEHGSTPLRSLYDALDLLFAGWRMSFSDEPALRVSDIKSYYAELSKRFGFPVTPPTEAYRSVARILLERGDSAGALESLRMAVTEYPYLADVHTRLGEALEKLGRKQEARLAYDNALRAASEDESSYYDPVEKHRKQLRQLQ